MAFPVPRAVIVGDRFGFRFVSLLLLAVHVPVGSSTRRVPIETALDGNGEVFRGRVEGPSLGQDSFASLFELYSERTCKPNCH